MKLFILLIAFFLTARLIIAQDNISRSIENILDKMTLEEKIGQMTQLNITTIVQDTILADYDNVHKVVLDTTKLINYVKNWHVGSFLNGRAFSAENWVYITETIQRINAHYSSVPVIYGIDHVHGANYLKNGTIFPHNINMGCSFDTTHIFNAARTSVYETAPLGHNWIFAPVLGIGRQKGWGRYYETFGEDPLLASRMGVAAVHGIQDFSATDPYRVAACPKHFLGYSDPKSGWDRSPAEIPDQALREFFLPSFKAAIEAGALTIMINSGEINGIPVHASYDILTKLLREELGFKGLAVSDWLDIKGLNEMHFVTANEKESTYLAVMAGIDISMVPEDTSFSIYLKELVNEGRIPISRIDESVRRILWVKQKLDLFETVMPTREHFDRINTGQSIELSLNAARESMVLIKNKNNILPLRNKKILLSGFTHDRKASLCGGWTYRFVPDSDRWFPEDMLTIKDAFEKTFGKNNIIYQQNRTIENVASEVDVIVIATGENEAYAETQGTIDDLHLDSGQILLIKEALASGKPVILILTEGRPRLIADVFDDVDAVLFAGLPGTYGAQAIAEIISGKVNPSGKMAFSYPKKSAHIISYNHKRSEFTTFREVSDELKRYSIAPFGHGLSYSTFEYANLIMDTLLTTAGQVLEISVDVTNTSGLAGKEAVLWFISDHVGTISRPVKQLAHFEKQLILPGETKTFTFSLNPFESLSFPDKNGNRLLEDGSFDVQVGNFKKQFWLKRANHK